MITRIQKDKWLAALRSGGYKQGHGYLRRIDEDGDESYCCLGVLAEVVGVSIRSNSVEHPDHVEHLDHVGREDLIGSWAGKNRPREKFDPEDRRTHTTLQRKLAAMNDTRRYSFKQIASWIERNVPCRKS